MARTRSPQGNLNDRTNIQPQTGAVPGHYADSPPPAPAGESVDLPTHSATANLAARSNIVSDGPGTAGAKGS